MWCRVLALASDTVKGGRWDDIGRLVFFDFLIFSRIKGVAVFGVADLIIRVATVRVVQVGLGEIQVMQPFIVFDHVSRWFRYSTGSGPRKHFLLTFSLLLSKSVI